MPHGSHLGITFNHEALISRFRQNVPERVIAQRTGLVGIGMSGSAAVPVLARHFNLPFALVREHKKAGRDQVEGTITGNDPWIFVDDCICSGRTLADVLREMGRAGHTNYRGAFTFGHDHGDRAQFATCGNAEREFIAIQAGSELWRPSWQPGSGFYPFSR